MTPATRPRNPARRAQAGGDRTTPRTKGTGPGKTRGAMPTMRPDRHRHRPHSTTTPESGRTKCKNGASSEPKHCKTSPTTHKTGNFPPHRGRAYFCFVLMATVDWKKPYHGPGDTNLYRPLSCIGCYRIVSYRPSDSNSIIVSYHIDPSRLIRLSYRIVSLRIKRTSVSYRVVPSWMAGWAC